MSLSLKFWSHYKNPNKSSMIIHNCKKILMSIQSSCGTRTPNIYMYKKERTRSLWVTIGKWKFSLFCSMASITNKGFITSQHRVSLFQQLHYHMKDDPTDLMEMKLLLVLGIELECVDHMPWMSMQSLEEKEHEIRIMTKNASRFVRLIVKECFNRNPVRVWSLLLREATNIG